MRKFTLALLAGGLFVGLLVFGARQAFAQPIHASQTYNVPPGKQNIIFDVGTQPDVTIILSFVLGGHPGLKILSIVGTTGFPGFWFEDASPFDVTVFFAQGPTTGHINTFQIDLDNTTNKDQMLEIGSLARPAD